MTLKLNHLCTLLALIAFIKTYGQPTVSSFTPTNAKFGTSISINGTNFNTTPSNNIVYFGGMRANVTASTSTSITATLPIGATYGPVSVNVSNLSYSSFSCFTPTFGNSESLSSSSFSGSTSITAASGPLNLTSGDIDGDGKIDLVTANQTSSSFSVFRNTSTLGTISSSSFASKADFSCTNQAQGLTLGDIDGDGKLDVIVAINSSNLISVFRNTSTSGSVSFASAVSYSTGSTPYFLSTGDLDFDGKPEIVVTNFGSNTVSVFRNTSSSGSVSLAAKFDLSVGSNPHDIKIQDLDGDGKNDIVNSNYNPNNLYIFRNIHSSGTLSGSSFASFFSLSTGSGSTPVGVESGDIDGDGKHDILCTNQSSSTISIFRNTSSSGSLSFSSATTLAAGNTARSVRLSDMNGDGKVDIIAANIGSDNMQVYQNNSSSGSISIATGNTFSTGDQPFMAIAVDIDGDYKPEIVSANYNATSLTIYRNAQVNTEPTVASSNLSFSNNLGNSIQLNFTAGNGERRIILAKANSSVNSTPIDERDYVANSTFGSGSQIGSGNYVVYSGSGNSVTVSGLTTGITYHFAIFEYNGQDATSNFLISSFETNSQLLPVELLDFSGIRKGVNSASLSWTTTWELNNNYFGIERSIDGLNYVEIEKISSKHENGTSNTICNYSHIDNTIPENINIYYRLNQRDFNGNTTISKTIVVPSIENSVNPSVSIYPNPAKSILIITLEDYQVSSTPNKADIFNINGGIEKTILLNNNKTNIDVSDLKSGLYYIKIGAKSVKFTVLTNN